MPDALNLKSVDTSFSRNPAVISNNNNLQLGTVIICDNLQGTSAPTHGTTTVDLGQKCQCLRGKVSVPNFILCSRGHLRTSCTNPSRDVIDVADALSPIMVK